MPTTVPVFFYGLFMDMDLLRQRGLVPRQAALAVVDGFRLRVGQRADLVPDAGSRAHGVVASLTEEEVDRLYADPAVRAYSPRSVAARRVGDGVTLMARCYTLPPGTAPTPTDATYVAKLREVGERIGIPWAYFDSLE